MECYQDWLESVLKQYRSRPGAWARLAIPQSYSEPGGVLYDFGEWMSRRDIQPDDQELTIWRVVDPFLDAAESGWVEVGASDFLCQDWTKEGGKKDERLIKFLTYRIESEKLRLEVRGSVQHRIQNLAAATEADAAAAAALPAEASAARVERDRVYWNHRIPASYVLCVAKSRE